MALIALSVLSIILESFSGIYVRWRFLFQTFEIITVVVFSVEYLLRIWTADLLYPESKHPRVKYFFSIMALIDLLAILPFYLPFIAADLRFLRMMRLFRLFRLLRVFKLGRYFDALQVIFRVIRTSGPRHMLFHYTVFRHRHVYGRVPGAAKGVSKRYRVAVVGDLYADDGRIR